MKKTTIWKISHVLVLVLALTIILAACSGGDDTPAAPTNPTTAGEFTTRGWQRFESNDFSGALADFNDALVLDATSGQAHAGLGWTRLQLATSAVALQTALSSFDQALTAGENGAYVLAGRSAVNLGLGGVSLPAAIADAEVAGEADAGFVFAHRASFNRADLHLIVAFAEGAQGHLPAALTAGNAVTESGISAGDSGTWSVGGVTFTSFDSAVLAFLQQLSNTHAG